MTGTHLEKRLIGYARVSTYGQTLDTHGLSSCAPPGAAAGTSTVLNWFCLLGAMEALGRKPDKAVFLGN